MSNSRSFGLDLARAIAIGMVLFSHFGHSNFDAFGVWGVELFFALSGYLIGQILWRNFSQTDTWTLKQVLNFWSRRWWRTLPNYYLFFIVALLFSYLTDGVWPAFGRVAQFLWFGQNLLDAHFDFYPVSWSLCIEEWFYLSFPIVLFLIFKTGLSAKRSFSLTLILFFAASITIRYFLSLHGRGESLSRISFARLDAIGSGVAMAYVMQFINDTKRLRQVLFIAGAAIVLIPAILMLLLKFPVELLKQNGAFLLTAPIGFALTLPFVNSLQPWSGVLKNGNTLVNKLSLWSYSIYLSHVPLMWLAYHVMGDLRQSVAGNLLSKLLGLVLTLVVSGLIFHFFEVPFTNKRPKEFKPSREKNTKTSDYINAAVI